MGVNEAKNSIKNNKTALGIEFGSTRIKAVLVDENNMPIAQEAMTGRTVWKTESGPIIWRIFMQDFRAATGLLPRM